MSLCPSSPPSVDGLSALVALDKAQEEEVMRLAAVGMNAADIAVAMEWQPERCAAFCRLAATPGSRIAMLLAAGRVTGRAEPLAKLQEAAVVGNVDAIKALQKVQAFNRYSELINHMDEDEFTD